MREAATKIIVPFLFLIALDQALKMWALSHSAAAALNQGIVSGFLSDAPELYRRVFVSTFYGLIFFLFALGQSAILKRHSGLAIAITVFFAGISSNAFDRILNGAVLDFIRIGRINANPADLFQWIGLASSIAILTKDRHRIFHPHDQRGRILINPAMQLRFARQAAFVALSSCLLTGVFSYTFLLSLNATVYMPVSLGFFRIAFLLVTLGFTAVVFLAALFTSHRIAGPLYAVTRWVDELLAGRATRALKLRQGDELKALETTAKSLLEAFSRKR